MENATKALIMAGAILIAILLISVGIMIFNSAKEPAEAAQDAGELVSISTFNNQFLTYCGDSVKGSTVRDLKNYVDTYNSKNPTKTIDFTGVPAEGIKLNKDYKVTPGYVNGNGYITSISVSE